jgi:hypothetical protein
MIYIRENRLNCLNDPFDKKHAASLLQCTSASEARS